MDLPVGALNDQLELAQMFNLTLSVGLGGELQLPLSILELLQRVLKLVPAVEVPHEPHFLKCISCNGVSEIRNI